LIQEKRGYNGHSDCYGVSAFFSYTFIMDRNTIDVNESQKRMRTY